MAGSYSHCIDKEFNVRENPCELLDHLGDASEAIEEMVFMIKYLANNDPKKIWEALEAFKKHAYAHDASQSFESWLQYQTERD